MAIELDHIFVCTSAGAPEADRLLRFGLSEGPSNRHEGQGTANRRFSFKNAMLELFWVSSEKEARSDRTRRTLLWERWSGRGSVASPFGICLRPRDAQTDQASFPGWDYRPSYLPSPLAMQVAEAGLDEPMWIYFDVLTRSRREQYFVEHPAGIREITNLVLTCPAPLRSPAAQMVVEARVLSTKPGTEHLLEIEFDHSRRQGVEDFRPQLPLVFKF